MTRKILLACGVLSSLLYVGIDVLAALVHPEYHSFTSQFVSELMANGAPTERLVDPLYLLYDLLLAAFGVGVWRSAEGKRALRAAGGLLVANGVIGFGGPLFFEMNMRGSGGGVAREDVLHIAVTSVLSILILLAIGFSAAAWGGRFRSFSIAAIITMLVFGALGGIESRHLAAGEPTPWLGALERIGIGAYLVWVAGLSIALLWDSSTSARRLVGRERLA